MKENDLLEIVREKLCWLRLPGMAEQLGPLLEKAAKDNLAALEVVDSWWNWYPPTSVATLGLWR